MPELEVFFSPLFTPVTDTVGIDDEEVAVMGLIGVIVMVVDSDDCDGSVVKGIISIPGLLSRTTVEGRTDPLDVDSNEDDTDIGVILTVLMFVLSFQIF